MQKLNTSNLGTLFESFPCFLVIPKMKTSNTFSQKSFWILGIQGYCFFSILEGILVLVKFLKNMGTI